MKRKKILIIGVWLIVAPLLGFPPGIRTTLIIMTGLGLGAYAIFGQGAQKPSVKARTQRRPKIKSVSNPIIEQPTFVENSIDDTQEKS